MRKNHTKIDDGFFFGFVERMHWNGETEIEKDIPHKMHFEGNVYCQMLLKVAFSCLKVGRTGTSSVGFGFCYGSICGLKLLR